MLAGYSSPRPRVRRVSVAPPDWKTSRSVSVAEYRTLARERFERERAAYRTLFHQMDTSPFVLTPEERIGR